MWDLKAFVSNMWPRRSKPVEAGKVSQPLLKEIMRALQNLENQGVMTQEMRYRAQLMALIFPKVLQSNKDSNRLVMNNDALQDWAFACGGMIGLLAGVNIQEHAMDGAIEEVMLSAKHMAIKTHNAVEKHFTAKAGAPTADGAAVSSLTQHQQMITDLQRQVELETDPAAKAALRAMAESLRKGEKKENAA